MSEAGDIQNEGLGRAFEALEKDEWAPVANLRPHHFNTSVKSALRLGGIPKNTLLNRMFYKAGQYVDSTGYFKDIVGSSDKQLQEFRHSQMSFLDILHHLPNDAVIQFDLKPDGICSSCQIGEHCTATNLRTKPKPIPLLRKDWAKWEESKLNKIRTKLIEYGYKEGKDFTYRPTKHVLYDFGGKTLNESPSPVPQDSNFNSMLVKVSALRGII